MEKIIEKMGLWEELVPSDNFKFPFPGSLKKILNSDSEAEKNIIQYANRCCNKIYPAIPVTLYKRFTDDGNRGEYEALYNERRNDLFYLALAESIEDNGRYINKIFDLIWAICEETTWILPAHYCQYKKSVNIPDNYGKGEHFIDLYSASTGAFFAVVYYLLKDKINAFGGSVISERVLNELNSRIINPFLKYDDMHWMGLQGQFVNNWTPWIVSNVLTVAGVITDDIEVRKEIVKKASRCLDCFIVTYNDDGGCNEGPRYWTHAGGSLFDALEILFDLTGGAERVFSPQLKPIFEYIAKVHICDTYFVNYGDNTSKMDAWGNFFKRIGKVYSLPELMDLDGGEYFTESPRKDFYQHPIRFVKNLYEISHQKCDSIIKKVSVLPDMQLCVMRENDDKNTGFCTWLKGGHNGESHNHNDVGSIGIYLDGKPLLVDIGIGEYTKFTFSEYRYTLFPIRSCDHNIPMIGDTGEIKGSEYKADTFTADEQTPFASIEYGSAYENRDLINKVSRALSLYDGKVILDDFIDLKTALDVKFNLYFCEEVTVNDKEIVIGDRVKMTVEGNMSVFAEKVDSLDKKLCEEWKNGIYKVTLDAGETKQTKCKCVFERINY